MERKIIAVGSKNPVKINSALKAFERCWPDYAWEVRSTDTTSGVSGQPMDDEEGISGARNRAKGALENIMEAEYGVGLEGSLHEINGLWLACGWVVVRNRLGQEGIGASPRILMPPKSIELVKQGYEAGEAFDMLTKRENTKQQEGFFGILTKGAISREEGYRDGVIMALTYFLSPEFYG